MIEILDAVLPLAGVLVGFILGRRERNHRRPVMYACDCGHSLSMHHAGDGKKVSTSCTECGCRQYIGSRPIEIDLAPRQINP